MNVVAPKDLHHALMPSLSRIERHLQRKADGRGYGLGLVRVDDQCPIELRGCTRELREHEHTRVQGVLRRHVLLRDEIHAISQRRHEANLGQPVKTSQSSP